VDENDVPKPTGRSRKAAPATARFILANQTDRLTVTYLCQWGMGEWESVTLGPGEAEEHWCPLNAAGRVGVPRVKFRVAAGGAFKTCRLRPALVPTGPDGPVGSARRYSFLVTDEEWTIDLFEG
jgi:hypothetical protein